MNNATQGSATRRGVLWERLVARSAAAQAGGHQYSLPTHGERFEAQGLPYLVRVVDNLSRKDRDKLAAAHNADEQAHPFSPFLPPEEHLFVSDLSPTHFAVLNKFNVLDHHLLIVTRQFEEQDEPLNAADFAALWQCLSDFPSLGFYNGGEASGASQRHKHLQVIPVEAEHALPWLALYDRNARPGAITSVPELPFPHALIGLEGGDDAAPGERLAAVYRTLIRHLGWHEATAHGDRPRPYNLLVTPRWMVLVPRRRECWETVSLNALAFVGALLVRSATQKQALVAAGPLRVLRSVCAAV